MQKLTEQKAWQVDLATCTATHQSGLIVKFVKAEDDPRAWDGVAVNDDIWFTQHFKMQPVEELQTRLASLVREAGAVYLAHLKRRQ